MVEIVAFSLQKIRKSFCTLGVENNYKDNYGNERNI